MVPLSAFTTTYNSIQKRLINEAYIISGKEEMYTSSAQWDTGASGTCISQAVINRLGLIPISQIMIKTPSGERLMNVYLVDIKLRNDVIIKDVQAMGSEIGNQGIDVLIGMDIISLGDFSVSNYNGKTQFTFRMPSQCDADYVRDIKKRKI